MGLGRFVILARLPYLNPLLTFSGFCVPNTADVSTACSVWSVDLAHLLRRFGVDVQLLTVTIGANPGFAEEKFYKVSL